MRTNRISDIEEYIIQHKNVSLDKLCEVFEVSKNTIRRDINELTNKGTIKKVYGGVALNEAPTLIPFNERSIKNITSKSKIGEQCANYINDGDVIFMDSGTTTLSVIDYLKDKQNITIITNNLEIVVKSLDYSNLNIICLPGNLIRKTNSLVSVDTTTILRKYNITKSFMASTGISIECGITNSHPLESEIKKLAMEKSLSTYLLVDSSKFDHSSLVTYGKLEDIDYLITDKNPPKKYANFCYSNDISLVICDE
ncbi:MULTISPECIES: DeoR/GlpR family DNA-binding transcription regulator [Terrisporobacter]|uniref:DeoR/GlpR family DNA-binding transcription regulator n=1 Tax=Terrisporobacter muris TaxID=2963284 RepID=A0A9X2M7B1_9FIRM|nr:MULTISPECIES: DeoR/GlpR family DNA-binding transcription regulator [Terrisporobacter]MCC3670278.1 DeoR/GlpR family DNA-binding transcription regulator [Terrisporobacter mayombei]MCR1821508.1 DeoR/GlpR family DNA-binding transcription regulator [Terrisporobacter muris]MDY3371733.1 DeoR/GlpR family DNA-binding transcription regulator [Terrisporobacter othiniensis]